MGHADTQLDPPPPAANAYPSFRAPQPSSPLNNGLLERLQQTITTYYISVYEYAIDTCKPPAHLAAEKGALAEYQRETESRTPVMSELIVEGVMGASTSDSRSSRLMAASKDTGVHGGKIDKVGDAATGLPVASCLSSTTVLDEEFGNCVLFGVGCGSAERDM